MIGFGPVWTQHRADPVELVGPKGYIHGWIKVGMTVTHKDGSEGLVTKYDPNTQTAHIDFKTGPRAGKANKTTTKAYHLIRPAEGEKKTPEAPDDVHTQLDSLMSGASQSLNKYTGSGLPHRTQSRVINKHMVQAHETGWGATDRKQWFEVDKSTEQLSRDEAARRISTPQQSVPTKSERDEVKATGARTPDQMQYLTDRSNGDTHEQALAKVRGRLNAERQPRNSPGDVRNEMLQKAIASGMVDQTSKRPKYIRTLSDQNLQKVGAELFRRATAGDSSAFDPKVMAAISQEVTRRRDAAAAMSAYRVKAPRVQQLSDGYSPALQKKFQDTADKVVAQGPARAPAMDRVSITDSPDLARPEVLASMDHQGVMRVRADLHHANITARHRQMELQGWFTKAENADSSAHAQMTHEYGHHLDNNLPGNVRNEMLQKVGAELGFTHRPADQLFAPAAKASVVNKAGIYAATNKHELVAELYKEGTLSKNPSRAAQIVRQTMLDQFGGPQ